MAKSSSMEGLAGSGAIGTGIGAVAAGFFGKALYGSAPPLGLSDGAMIIGGIFAIAGGFSVLASASK